jgi:hypothetical protein
MAPPRPPVVCKRRSFSASDKATALRVLAENKGNKRATALLLQKWSGFESLTRLVLRRWEKAAEAGRIGRRRTGRPVNVTFEREVLANLVFTVLEKVGDREQARQLANVAYSYDVIRAAAKATMAQAPWASEDKIKRLGLSNKWITGFLRRNTLRRRRVTTAQRELPPVGVVRARMTSIQQVIQDGGYAPCDVISADVDWHLLRRAAHEPVRTRGRAALQRARVQHHGALHGSDVGRRGRHHGPALHHHQVRGHWARPAQHAHPRHRDAVPGLHSRRWVGDEVLTTQHAPGGSRQGGDGLLRTPLPRARGRLRDHPPPKGLDG